MNFFEKLFEGNVVWAMHTTMTCNLAYSIELAYQAVGKCAKLSQYLTTDEVNRTAVFYHASKKRFLTFKTAEKKLNISKYFSLAHPITSDQTYHAKISLVYYYMENNSGLRLAVYSKNHDFTDSCADIAMLYDIEPVEGDTETGKALCAYIEKLHEKTDEKGKQWLDGNIIKNRQIWDKLSKAQLIDCSGKKPDLYFGGVEQGTSLGEMLMLDKACSDSIVLTPPEFIRDTNAQCFFAENKFLYDLKPKNKLKRTSSHIKLYLLHKKDNDHDYYELWFGSANATCSGIGWNFKTPFARNPHQSVECLVRYIIDGTLFKTLSNQIIGNYRKFTFEKNEKGSLKVVEDDFGPWVCNNFKVISLKLLNEQNEPVCGSDVNKEQINKISVELQKLTNELLLDFNSPQVWRPMEYRQRQMCLADWNCKENQTISIEYSAITSSKFSPSQGVICFGTSDAVMQVDPDLLQQIPTVEEKIFYDERISDMMLNMGRADALKNNSDELDWFVRQIQTADRELMTNMDGSNKYAEPDRE